jgi:hypothetical protein
MDLPPDQQAEAQRLFEQLQSVLLEEARRLAQLLAAKPTSQLFGTTAFEVRAAVHRLGARTLEAALDPQGGSRQARQTHQEVLTYFTNQAHRMDYPCYRAKGWQIGAGPVASACKSVVGQRLQGAGMRWGEDGADALCHLRALFRSEPTQWEAFWGHN